SLLSSRYRLLPASVRAAADALLPPLRKLDTAPGIDRFAQFHFLKEEKLKPLLSPIAYREYSASGFFTERFFREVKRPFETQFMRVDRESWLVDESLLRTDKMNMAAGLEARVPLLDLPLVSFADAILLKHKVSLSRTKIILKKAFEGRIPDGLLSQPKRGWFSPGAKWLRYREMADFAREVLSARYTEATEPLFNWEAVRARLDAHLRGEYHFTELWMILTLQLWARQFKLTA
ncbi:MAG: asparagine synthase-related protein, partial [bacterium]|nr:asparagine synthase-related protein [bacterium]